ncbi:OLC1v1019423C1 [Oldenlandia corymbosa var. corymbosa]|uniref:OLC1v1019423C1 n=1 Tax=Oldenlandia corymbosa var. corymbosa TaxID=529605 RepID=A0AAV1EED4_OLDCO|nr:OLC1v1019423C1 [Oldenlandia corymbosa var. corymbosa]
MEESLQPISSSYSSLLSKQEISGTSGKESLKIFPDELIIEILTWLPAKTLVKFRCVSKSWRALISTPNFIKAHLGNSSKRDDYAHHRVLFRCKKRFGKISVLQNDTRYFALAPAMFGDVNTPVESTPVEDPVMNSSEAIIVGASNGIVCVCVKGDIFFWDPTIRKFKELPYFLVSSKQNWGHRQACFDGKTNSWRKSQGIVGGLDQLAFLVRGKLYWKEGTGRKAEICYFDLKTETYGVLQQPDYGSPFYLGLGTFEDSLSVICYHPRSHIDLWIIKEERLRRFWTKVLLVPTLKDPSCKKSCLPVFMSKDGKILFAFWKFLALSGPMKKSVTYPSVKSMGEAYQLEVLVESLVLINDHDAKEPVKDTDVSVIDMMRHLGPHFHLV